MSVCLLQTYVCVYISICICIYVCVRMYIYICVCVCVLFWSYRNIKNCFNSPLSQKTGGGPEALGDLLKVTQLGFEPNETPGLCSHRVPLEGSLTGLKGLFLQAKHVQCRLLRRLNTHSKEGAPREALLLLSLFTPAAPTLRPPGWFTHPRILVSPTVLTNGSCSRNVCK